MEKTPSQDQKTHTWRGRYVTALQVGIPQGIRLSEYLENPATTNDFLGRTQIAAQVVTAVTEMHAKKFYHHDIRPSNFQVSYDGAHTIKDSGESGTLPDDDGAGPTGGLVVTLMNFSKAYRYDPQDRLPPWNKMVQHDEWATRSKPEKKDRDPSSPTVNNQEEVLVFDCADRQSYAPPFDNLQTNDKSARDLGTGQTRRCFNSISNPYSDYYSLGLVLRELVCEMNEVDAHQKYRQNFGSEVSAETDLSASLDTCGGRLLSPPAGPIPDPEREEHVKRIKSCITKLLRAPFDPPSIAVGADRAGIDIADCEVFRQLIKVRPAPPPAGAESSFSAAFSGWGVRSDDASSQPPLLELPNDEKERPLVLRTWQKTTSEDHGEPRLTSPYKFSVVLPTRHPSAVTTVASPDQLPPTRPGDQSASPGEFLTLQIVAQPKPTASTGGAGRPPDSAIIWSPLAASHVLPQIVERRRVGVGPSIEGVTAKRWGQEIVWNNVVKKGLD
ncbi:unnamed protein product, partial [Amoebophrya sp. A120]|eukprot:GSA120T00014753001.1